MGTGPTMPLDQDQRRWLRREIDMRMNTATRLDDTAKRTETATSTLWLLIARESKLAQPWTPVGIRDTTLNTPMTTLGIAKIKAAPFARFNRVIRCNMGKEASMTLGWSMPGRGTVAGRAGRGKRRARRYGAGKGQMGLELAQECSRIPRGCKVGERGKSRERMIGCRV
jgi:hypothetical protein